MAQSFVINVVDMQPPIVRDSVELPEDLKNIREKMIIKGYVDLEYDESEGATPYIKLMFPDEMIYSIGSIMGSPGPAQPVPTTELDGSVLIKFTGSPK